MPTSNMKTRKPASVSHSRMRLPHSALKDWQPGVTTRSRCVCRGRSLQRPVVFWCAVEDLPVNFHLACNCRVRPALASSLVVDSQDDDFDPVILEGLGKLQHELTAYELFDAAFHFHGENPSVRLVPGPSRWHLATPSVGQNFHEGNDPPVSSRCHPVRGVSKSWLEVIDR